MATIKGRWLFNDGSIVTPPSGDSFTEKVNFSASYNNTQYDFDGMIVGSSGGKLYVTYTGLYVDAYIYPEWQGGLEYVDFGTIEQTVSDKFYNWFTTNAEPYVEQTYELSGIWKFNETINVDGGAWYSVNFTSNGGSYVAMSDRQSETSSAHDMNLRYFTGQSSGTISIYAYSGGVWQNEAYRIVDLGSTTQTVSEEFYNWFTANAELYTEEETPTITNLTGYTVTVPAGWSANAGYGVYDINYNITYDSTTWNEMSKLAIGYRSSNPPFDVFDITLANIIEIFSSFGAIGTAQDFTITITGGDDSSNSELIQWLVDNNATFTKKGEEEPEEPDTPEEPTQTATITYDGATVALKEGQTATFRFAEKVFKSDIMIRNNTTKNLISFTIDGTTYYAEEGMTWGEWRQRDYGTTSYMITGISAGPGIYVDDVISTDVIIAGKAYNTEERSLGDSN